MRLVCHPDNATGLIEALRLLDTIPDQALEGVSIIPDPSMPIWRELKGRFLQPDGRIVSVEDICINYRFYRYGPEDFEWLRFAGLLVPAKVPAYFVINF